MLAAFTPIIIIIIIIIRVALLAYYLPPIHCPSVLSLPWNHLMMMIAPRKNIQIKNVSLLILLMSSC